MQGASRWQQIRCAYLRHANIRSAYGSQTLEYNLLDGLFGQYGRYHLAYAQG